MSIRGQDIWTGLAPQTPPEDRIRGIFADADAIARRKVRGRAMLRGGDCLRKDAAGI
jgi:hypothetical protein